jgi:hypothetical protein
MLLFVRVSKNETHIRNDTETLVFATNVYERTKLEKNENVYSEINRFLQTLPDEQQVQLFNVYKRILAQLRHSSDFNILTDSITALVTELYNLIDIQRLESWVYGFNKINYPTSVAATVGQDLNPDKTYIRSDYDALVILTIALRFMLPVWGEYQTITLPEVKGKWKEYVAARLLTNTSLINHRSVQRLSIFIETHIPSTAKKEAAIIAGLGTEEVPEWLLSGALVKRLAVADIHDEGGLIRNVFGYVNNYIKEMDQYWGGLRPKNAEGGDEDSSDFSIIEKYRGKKLRSEGDGRAAVVYVTLHSGRDGVPLLLDPMRLAKQIDPSVNEDIVRACYLTNMNSAPQTSVQEWQVILAQLIFYRTSMSPKSIAGLNKQQLVDYVFVASQALLLHWNFVELALLIKAVPLVIADESVMLHMSQLDRIAAKTMDPLDKTYPYKLNTTKAATNNRQANPAYVGIGALTQQMNKSHWSRNVSEELKPFLNYQIENLVGPISDTTQEDLAQLAIRLNSRGN